MLESHDVAEIQDDLERGAAQKKGYSMKTYWMAVIPIGLLLAACDRPEQSAAQTAVESANAPTSEDAFVKAFVAAISAKDASKREALLHPKCRAAVTDANRAFFDEMSEGDLALEIPADYGLTVTPIAPDDALPFASMVTYPARPTHTVQIDYEKSENKGVTLVRWVVVEEGKWWLCQPIPTAEALAKRREMKNEAKRRQARAAELKAELKDPLLAELEDFLEQGQKIQAMKHYRDTTGEGLAMAKAVVELIQAESGP